MSPIKTNLKQISDYPFRYKVTDTIEVKQDEFHKLELFDLDTFRIEQELFSNKEQVQDVPIKKASQTRK